MESTQQLEKNYGPSAFTERTYTSNISVSQNKKWMSYCVGTVVVVRSLEDLKTCKIFTGHRFKTTAAAFSLNNCFVASGDVQGNIKIWFLDDLSIKKEFDNALGTSKITGIEWNDESNKLFFYGEGKNLFGRCISWDMGNNVGEISNHSKTILAGDIRKCRPYRIATGGEDFLVNFYEGTPFKFKKMHTEHNNFVTGVKFSPDNAHFVSVGFDKKIVLYDGKEGTLISTIAENKSAGNHTMAIMGVCWIDNTLIATCSLDRTVKVWDIKEKTCKFTLYPREKTLLDIPDSGCGINTNGKYLFTLSLSGSMNFWEIEKLEDGKLPDKVIDGHQNYISNILLCKAKSVLISSDVNGKIIFWKGDDNEYIKTFALLDKKVVSLALSCDDVVLFVLTVDGTLSAFDLDSAKLNYSLKLEGNPKQLTSSKTDPNSLFVLLEKYLYHISEGKIVNQAELSFNANCFDLNEISNEIYIGDTRGFVNVFDLTLKSVSKHQLHTSEVSAIKVSNNGSLVASGDNNKNVFVWNSSTKEMVINRFVYHSGKIFELDWSSDDTYLVSCSLDLSAIVWNVAQKSKLKTFNNVDVEVVTAVKFVSDKEFVTGGYSCGMKRFII